MGLRDHESLGVRARYRELERFKRERVIASWQQPGAQRSTRVIRFLEELTITSGELAGQDFQVRGFQREFIKAVYREDKRGVRPVRTAVLSMGRKNGKTQLAAALALCALCGPEAESRGEVYSCANDRFQASKIFHEMVALIKGNRYLSTRCNVLRHSKMIEDLENGSIYAALSRDAKTKMGLNPSFVVYDELGSSPDRELYDAMDSAMGARKNPLMLVISTQAADDLAPMSRLIDYGLRVQSGEVEDKSFYLKFHHAPMDADPWSKAAWEAANPPLGYFRSLDDIERQAQQAQRMPDLENSFRNLILNQRVAAETKFINPGAWKACAGEAIIPPGAKVHAGLDLGSTRDLSALVIVYENPLDGTFHVQAHFWLPGDVLARRDEDRVPYDVWVKEGFLYPAGEATDPEAIALKRPSLTQSIPSRASRSTVGRSPICAGRWTSSASACRSSSMARLQGHEPGGEHAGKRGRYQEAASRRQSAADLDGAERGGDVRSGEEPQARQIQEHRPHRRRRRTGDGARDRQPAASVRSGNSGSDDRLMKMIGHSRATRVPVIAGPRLTSAGKPDDDCCPFQHGAHIDSMPIEEPLEPIRNPSAKMLLFNRAKPDQS